MESELGNDVDATVQRERLRALKLAFNAKPDFLIISGKEALMIEAKVESGIGKYGRNGENQVKTQALISELLMEYVPSFQGVEISHLTLGKGVSGSRKTSFDLTWDQIFECVDNSEVDDFTRTSLAGLVVKDVTGYSPETLNLNE